jgi:hypothetical protein
MIWRRAIGFLLLCCFLALGCSDIRSPSRMVWTARPEFREVDNSQFDARIEPQKGEYPFYVYFLFTLRNLSDTDLIIDWNASRYLFNGNPQGPLVFEGIDPETIKSASIPPQTIAPGMVFTRRIMPLKRIAWSPLSENSLSEHRITPGMLPAGENGVRIALRRNDERLTLPLSIQISGEPAP